MNTIQHVWFECPKPCPYQELGHCHFCDAGLARCTVCGASEGELLTTCPGFMLNQEALEACYQGNVKDFLRLKRYALAGFNIRKGTWER